MYSFKIYKSILILNLFILVKCNETQQLCEDDNSVDLTDAVLQDGVLVKHGVKFSSKYVYSKNVSGEIRKYGCACKFNNCFRKCCPLGQVYYINPPNKYCVESPEYEDLVQLNGINISYHSGYIGNLKFTETEENSFFYGIPCEGSVYFEDDYPWFVQKDGSLYIEVPNRIPSWIIRDPNKYCVDTFIFEQENGTKTTNFDALVCFEEDEDSANYLLSSTCMIISCVFILATVTVYAWLPELRNLHGRVLMAYLISVFVAFSILGTMQILLFLNNIMLTVCVTMTFIIYFALLAAFFWLNVMCFDIWWTFSGKRGRSLEKFSERTKFYAYCKYAFGVPTVLTALLIGLEFSGMPPRPFLPSIRQDGCFLTGDTKLLYLYVPMVILCVANSIFFTLTACKIAETKRQTIVLKSGESATHDKQKSEKQRLLLYLKLYAVMGVNWILEVISHFFPKANKIWYFTDAYNVLIGLFIFIIFVCKRKIFRHMKKRIKDKIVKQKEGMGSMTIPQRQMGRNLKDYGQRDSLDTIRTDCPDSDSNKEINTTVL